MKETEKKTIKKTPKAAKTPRTPKKKKRKLKKSVKRGCLGIILFVVLFAGLTIYECTRPRGEAEVPRIEWLEREPDHTDSLLAQRLDKVVRTPMHIDTASLGICIYDLQQHATVYTHHPDELMTPASCMKLLTAIAALKGLGCDHCYESRLFTRGAVANGTLQGDVMLCLDDDPEVESLVPFAQALSQKGIQRIEGKVFLDLVRRDTLRQHHTAMPWDIPYRKLTLLLKGEEVVKKNVVSAFPIKNDDVIVGSFGSTSPAAEAGGLPTYGTDWNEVFALKHCLTQPMTPMLTNSSNIKAESIYHHLHHHQRRWWEEADGTEAPYSVARFLEEEMGMNVADYVINDGSGLSPDNRLTARLLTRLLIYAYKEEDVFHILKDKTLATPGNAPRRGSLTTRMSKPEYRGRIFCKTGTLATKAVSSLSGYAQGKDGRWYAFSIINTNTAVFDGRRFQDAICKELIR